MSLSYPIDALNSGNNILEWFLILLLMFLWESYSQGFKILDSAIAKGKELDIPILRIILILLITHYHAVESSLALCLGTREEERKEPIRTEMIQLSMFGYKGRKRKEWKLSDWFSLEPTFLCPPKVDRWGGIVEMIVGWF